MPENETAIDILLKAIIQLRSHILNPNLQESTKDLMQFIGPKFKFPGNMAMANQEYSNR